MEKHKKAHTTIINIKHELQSGMKSLTYQVGHILYQIFKIILSIFKKNIERKLTILQYKHTKIILKSRITFITTSGYYHELLPPETVKLLGSTKDKLTENKNGENVSHLELTEVELVHCNIVNNNYQQDSRFLYIFVPNKPFSTLLEF